jgi:hypothetical protein
MPSNTNHPIGLSPAERFETASVQKCSTDNCAAIGRDAKCLAVYRVAWQPAKTTKDGLRRRPGRLAEASARENRKDDE